MEKEKTTKGLLTERIVIRKGHPWFNGSKYSTQISRRIRNATTYLMRHEKKPNGACLSHSDADKWLKKNNQELYAKMPAAFSQRTTQIVGQDFKSYSAALKDFAKDPSKYKRKPRPPHYANKASTLTAGRNGFCLKKGDLHLAGDKFSTPLKTSFSFDQAYNAKVCDVIVHEVRIVPMGSCFVVEIIYNPAKLQATGTYCALLDKKRKAGIDLGINNLVAIATDQHDVRPALVNGKPLKSINAWYNKRAGKLRSAGKFQHLSEISNKRYHRTRDVLHRASRFVANYCVSNNIGTLVVGLNKGWKQDSDIGKVNNQKFVSIPHTVLIEQIKYKCYAVGITVIVREESYTSKASALDNDTIPTYGDKAIPAFSGRRVKRGLYKSPQGLVNADINSALNILRKETGEALSALACRGCMFQPVIVTLGKTIAPSTKREADLLPLVA
ncbi:RNA-guided endonuclease InsQ/TnpB family protein [Marinomonas algarum]|uniref:Transposase n=1 Tax=Marinomonas algarum TaxID=2883105 RepID=A0A9X1LFR7_9GAMM|nr:transposase [Marinomonas algarum]MCB5163136.1 transposase [Marinomonas algarum]